jgi:hypothetical protein
MTRRFHFLKREKFTIALSIILPIFGIIVSISRLQTRDQDLKPLHFSPNLYHSSGLVQCGFSNELDDVGLEVISLNQSLGLQNANEILISTFSANPPRSFLGGLFNLSSSVLYMNLEAVYGWDFSFSSFLIK